MYGKPSVCVEGDCEECTRCTCPPKRKKDKNIAASMKYVSVQNPLIQHERWMQRRSYIQEHLTKSLNRPAGDLLMNLSEDYRRIQEEKLLFEYSAIDTYFDKSRGSPLFWKMPPALYEPCDPRHPVYFLTTSKLERHEIPSIEYVATPSYLMEEKMLSCSRNLYTSGPRHNKHRKTSELSSKINTYQFHKPECKDIIVIGKKLQINEIEENETEETQLTSVSDKDMIGKKLHTLNEVREREAEKTRQERETEELKSESIKDEIAEVSSEKTFDSYRSPRVSFSINKTLLSNYNDFKSAVAKIRVIFECMVPMKDSKVEYLKFKNLGTATLRFHWNRVAKFLLFRDIVKCERENTHSFHFNKNVLLLPPDDTIHFPIWFKAKFIGNYHELWEITTEPQMWDSDYKLILTLQGFVYPSGFIEKSNSIRMMLEQRILNTVIRGILTDILQQLKFAETERQTLVFSEEQLFESANNMCVGVEKRPKYIYKPDAVEELKQLYEEVKFSHSPKTWNYSIKDLQMATRRKDVWVYVENQTIQMLKGKQRRSELNSSTREANASVLTITEKNSAVVVAKNESYSRRLDRILQELEHPSMVPNMERSKYFLAFSIFRTFSFKICDVMDHLHEFTSENNCYPCYNYKEVTSIEQLPDRLIFERFDDVWIDRTKKTSSPNVMDLTALPKPIILKNVPPSNFKMVYKIYFNVQDDTTKVRKNDSREKKEDKIKESKSLQGKSLKSSEKISKHKDIAPDSMHLSPLFSVRGPFDPFDEEYIPLDSPFPSITESIMSSRTTYSTLSRSVNRTECYQHQRHLMISMILVEAVNAIVDMLETLKEDSVSPEVLGEIKKCTDVTVEEVEPADVEISSELTNAEPEEMETNEMNLEDDPYFQNLLDSHLNKNLYTKDYIIEGKRKTSREEGAQNTIVASGSSKSWTFKSYDSIADISVKSNTSAGMQTSEQGNIDEEKELVNTVMPSHTDISNSNSTREDRFHSNDIFYYMEDGSDSKTSNK